MNKTRFVTEEEKEHLSTAVGMVRSGGLSLRGATDWLEHKTGKKISYEGLRKIIKKTAEEPVNDGPEEGVGTIS